MSSFRAAVESGDIESAIALLADDVVFTSPIAYDAYPGKPITAAILRAVYDVFADFRYVREYGGADDRDHALMFEAKVNGLDINGADFLRYNEDGTIAEFTVMVRPFRAAEALKDEMGRRFDAIVADAQAMAAG